MTYGYDVDAFKRKWFQKGYDEGLRVARAQNELSTQPSIFSDTELLGLREENKKLREEVVALEAKYLEAASAQEAKKYKATVKARQAGVSADLMHQHLKTDVVAYAKSFKELPEALQPYHKRLLEGIEAGKGWEPEASDFVPYSEALNSMPIVKFKPDHENGAPAKPIEERLNEDGQAVPKGACPKLTLDGLVEALENRRDVDTKSNGDWVTAWDSSTLNYFARDAREGDMRVGHIELCSAEGLWKSFVDEGYVGSWRDKASAQAAVEGLSKV